MGLFNIEVANLLIDKNSKRRLHCYPYSNLIYDRLQNKKI